MSISYEMNRWNDWFLENQNNDLKKNWSIKEIEASGKNQFLEMPLII